MLRCGQMMLAQALVYKHLGRGMKGIQYRQWCGLGPAFEGQGSGIIGVIKRVDEMHLKNGC